MDNNPKGPYKHYERPNKPRSAGERPSSGKGWGVLICVLLLILIVLIPVAHHFASGHNHTEKAQEVQTVKKTNKSSLNKKSVPKKKVKKVAKKKVKKPFNQSVSSSSVSSSFSSKTPKTYVVEPGDTLSGIADKNGMTIDRLAELNGLTTSSSVDAGQTLKLK